MVMMASEFNCLWTPTVIAALVALREPPLPEPVPLTDEQLAAELVRRGTWRERVVRDRLGYDGCVIEDRTAGSTRATAVNDGLATYPALVRVQPEGA
jgi:hypothetical protein